MKHGFHAAGQAWDHTQSLSERGASPPFLLPLTPPSLPGSLLPSHPYPAPFQQTGSGRHQETVREELPGLGLRGGSTSQELMEKWVTPVRAPTPC